MHRFSNDRRYKNRLSRFRIELTPWRVFSLTLCMTALALSQTGAAQQRVKTAASLSSYDYDRALEIIRQQIDATKTFDEATQRIAVLVRAADLLWPHQQQRARAAFTDAFELAILYFKEKGDRPKAEGVRLMVSTPDQRYVVISAIAKRDLAWAKKLTEQMLREESKEGQEEATHRNIETATKLLDAAFFLLPSDASTAVSFARRSLNYPASVELPMFLYKLAERSQPAADQFYSEAIRAYRDKPMSEFLYLSAYPFGNDREAGDMPSYARYQVPPGFAPNGTLQRLFLQMLLHRAQQALENPPDTGVGGEISNTGQIWLALTRLEPQVQQFLPDLLAPTQQARASIYVLLSQDSQLSLTGSIAAQGAPKKTFDEQVEAAEKQSDPDKRDQLLVFAVLRASDGEDLDHVVNAAQEISDSAARQQLLDWLYFVRSQNALKNKQLDEARRRAAKVEELDQRAYLFSEIAQESLKTIEDPTQARQLLDDVVTAAERAPTTIVTARTLLASAYLYIKIDMNRSVSVLGDAIKCINRLEAPDFSRQVVMRKIEGKNFGAYATLQTPGFNPENTLREIGKFNFDTALYLASNFADKSLRALTTLTLADLYLQQAQQQLKDEKAKKRRRNSKER